MTLSLSLIMIIDIDAEHRIRKTLVTLPMTSNIYNVSLYVATRCFNFCH